VTSVLHRGIVVFHFHLFSCTDTIFWGNIKFKPEDKFISIKEQYILWLIDDCKLLGVFVFADESCK